MTPSKNSPSSHEPTIQASLKEPIPAVGQPIGTILIPAINVNLVIVQGTNAPQLSEGPGHYQGTPLPGQPGNVAIAGHRTTYGAPFYDINALKAGNPIYITTPYGKFTYLVTGNEVVSPNDNAVLDSTSSKHILTLTTCNPRYSETSRLVVTAIEQG
jgi:sortase A